MHRDRDQPVIMLTAKSTDEDIIQGLSLGADDYVAKPFSVAQLVLRIQAVLRRSRIGAELDATSGWARILRSIAGICRAGEVTRPWHLPAARWRCCSISG